MRERLARVTRGTLRVRKHCVFRWWRAEQWWTDESAPRTVEIEPHHCDDCVAAVEKIARAGRSETVISRPAPLAVSLSV